MRGVADGPSGRRRVLPVDSGGRGDGLAEWTAHAATAHRHQGCHRLTGGQPALRDVQRCVRHNIMWQPALRDDHCDMQISSSVC